MLQYLSPTLQFLIGVYLYREPFTRSQFVGFACVWAALIVFGLEAVRARRGNGWTTRLAHSRPSWEEKP
jgi:chloramphenicol-sensitive protein RarD